eukprot:jgi/Tetstr1/455019/TSEL_041876.t1
MTQHQLRRDLEWWSAFPTHSNGRPIYKPVETVYYMHIDSSGYGYKELKAAQYTVFTFLSELRGRHVPLHEDTMGVVYILANLTSRSPLLMTELRKLWYILDANDIYPSTLHQYHGEHMG